MRLLEDATRGEFDVLLCTDLTRLTRQVTPEIIMALRKAGVRVMADDGSEVGIANLLFATASKTFVEAQSDRIKAGKRAAREQREATANQKQEKNA